MSETPIIPKRPAKKQVKEQSEQLEPSIVSDTSEAAITDTIANEPAASTEDKTGDDDDGFSESEESSVDEDGDQKVSLSEPEPAQSLEFLKSGAIVNSGSEIPIIPARPKKSTTEESIKSAGSPVSAVSGDSLPSIPRRPVNKSSQPSGDVPAIPKRPSKKAASTVSSESAKSISPIPSEQESDLTIDNEVQASGVGDHAPVESPSNVGESVSVVTDIIEPEKPSSSEQPLAEIASSNNAEEEHTVVPDVVTETHLDTHEGEVDQQEPIEEPTPEVADETEEATKASSEPNVEDESAGAKEAASEEITVQDSTSDEKSEKSATETNEEVKLPTVPQRPLSRPKKLAVDTERPVAKDETILTPVMQQHSSFSPSYVTNEILDMYGADSPEQSRMTPKAATEQVKKAAPPVKPKKASSKILAFQQQLMAQQEQEQQKHQFQKPSVPSRPKPLSRSTTGGSIGSTGSTGSTGSVSVNDSDSKTPEVPKTRPKKLDNAFTKNLTGLWGGVPLPGMTLPGQTLPSKQASQEDEDEEEKGEEVEAVKDVRRGRAKGPRGRKLPASATAPILASASKFEIHISDAWEFKKTEPEPEAPLEKETEAVSEASPEAEVEGVAEPLHELEADPKLEPAPVLQSDTVAVNDSTPGEEEEDFEDARNTPDVFTDIPEANSETSLKQESVLSTVTSNQESQNDDEDDVIDQDAQVQERASSANAPLLSERANALSDTIVYPEQEEQKQKQGEEEQEEAEAKDVVEVMEIESESKVHDEETEEKDTSSHTEAEDIP